MINKSGVVFTLAVSLVARVFINGERINPKTKFKMRRKESFPMLCSCLDQQTVKSMDNRE